MLRRSQVRRISASQAYNLKRKAHKYRLQQYNQLLKLGLSEAVANRAFCIWEDGCHNKCDRDVLDKVANFLEKRLQPHQTLDAYPMAS